MTGAPLPDDPTARATRVAVAAVVVGALLRLIVVILHPPAEFVHHDIRVFLDMARHFADGQPRVPRSPRRCGRSS